MKQRFEPHTRLVGRHEDMVERIRSILAGQDSVLVGMALAELLACWLAGHVFFEELELSERPETAKLREEFLGNHIDLVRDLIKFYDDDIRRKIKASAH